jgi:hypothetical protein
VRNVFAVFALCFVGAFAAVPASADSVLYDNTAPGTANTNAYAINNGSDVTDSFTLSSPSIITSVTFDVWLRPGDSLSNVDWSIGPDAFSGSGTTASTSSSEQITSAVAAGAGFDVFQESLTLDDLNLTPGTYWLTLQSATTSDNDNAYWDVSEGSSAAASNPGDASIPSETFQIDGIVTPEPSSILLLGSGLALVAVLVKRKIRL